MTSPINSLGTTISIIIIGSKRIGRHSGTPFLNPIEPAILNAISEESTSWYEPSYNLILTSTMGYPAITPPSIASWIPFSTAGI
jgi:hypothetical protein